MYTVLKTLQVGTHPLYPVSIYSSLLISPNTISGARDPILEHGTSNFLTTR